jgi:hypothetical protein
VLIEQHGQGRVIDALDALDTATGRSAAGWVGDLGDPAGLGPQGVAR